MADRSLSWFALFIVLSLANGTNCTAEPPMQFDVASIKLNNSGTTTMKFPPPADGRFQAGNFPLKALITFAYGVLGSQIANAPDWTNSERFDVDARAAGANITRQQYQEMLRSLLEERFKLNVHRETRDLPVYELEVAKTGSRLKAPDPQACVPAGDHGSHKTDVTCGAFFTGQSSLDGRSMSMPGFCDALGIVLGRPVSDRTGLAGRFDIHLEFDRDANPDGIEPSIFWAIQQQLGLRLQSHKEPTAVLVIDGLERLPTAN